MELALTVVGLTMLSGYILKSQREKFTDIYNSDRIESVRQYTQNLGDDLYRLAEDPNNRVIIPGIEPSGVRQHPDPSTITPFGAPTTFDTLTPVSTTPLPAPDATQSPAFVPAPSGPQPLHAGANIVVSAPIGSAFTTVADQQGIPFAFSHNGPVPTKQNTEEFANVALFSAYTGDDPYRIKKDTVLAPAPVAAPTAVSSSGGSGASGVAQEIERVRAAETASKMQTGVTFTPQRVAAPIAGTVDNPIQSVQSAVSVDTQRPLLRPKTDLPGVLPSGRFGEHGPLRNAVSTRTILDTTSTETFHRPSVVVSRPAPYATGVRNSVKTTFTPSVVTATSHVKRPGVHGVETVKKEDVNPQNYYGHVQCNVKGSQSRPNSVPKERRALSAAVVGNPVSKTVYTPDAVSLRDTRKGTFSDYMGLPVPSVKRPSKRTQTLRQTRKSAKASGTLRNASRNIGFGHLTVNAKAMSKNSPKTVMSTVSSYIGGVIKSVEGIPSEMGYQVRGRRSAKDIKYQNVSVRYNGTGAALQSETTVSKKYDDSRAMNNRLWELPRD